MQMKMSLGSVSVKIKANLSRRHLQTAILFAKQCRQIEDAEASLPWRQPRFDDSQSFAVGAVVVAVAALEASINELYLEAGDGGNDLVVALTEDQKQILVTRGRKSIDSTYCASTIWYLPPVENKGSTRDRTRTSLQLAWSTYAMRSCISNLSGTPSKTSTKSLSKGYRIDLHRALLRPKCPATSRGFQHVALAQAARNGRAALSRNFRPSFRRASVFVRDFLLRRLTREKSGRSVAKEKPRRSGATRNHESLSFRTP
jgi:hypothetical protein